MLRTLTSALTLALLLSAAPGCGGSVRVGTDPETATQQQRNDDAEIPTAGIDRQTETVPVVTVDIEREPDEPVARPVDDDSN